MILGEGLGPAKILVPSAEDGEAARDFLGCRERELRFVGDPTRRGMRKTDVEFDGAAIDELETAALAGVAGLAGLVERDALEEGGVRIELARRSPELFVR
ncbi:hypothetical protein C0992_003540 [Termitomyces sp. T32_za158]|nr:hypothetical protein C0992_003540 [Termitomyces sp. T32_za158]